MRFYFGCGMWTKTACLAALLGLSTATCSQEVETEDPLILDPEVTEPDPEDPEDPGSGDDDGGDDDDDDGGGGTGMYPTGGSLIPPQPEVSGTETPVSAKYWPMGFDLGVADPNEKFRAVLVFQLRNQADLTTLISQLYDPSSPQFRQYLSVNEFMSRHAPTTTTVDAVTSWLTSQGFKIERTARNRLMLHYSGTVAQFNIAFGTELHLIRRTETTWRAPAYAPMQPLAVPPPLIGKIKRLLMPDPEVEKGTLSNDSAPINTTPPPTVQDNLVPQQLATAYGLSEMYAQGYKGAGMTIGVIGATMFRFSDAQSMWQTFGITRANPTVVETMEPMITRDLETSLDIQLAGAFAPDANVIFYGGPNNSDTTLLYTFNEAVGLAQAQVLSDSFAHAEASTPYTVGLAYNESSLMAAALGITVLSASGDSNQVDVPSNSPYVTSVGGTNVELNPDNSWKTELSWGLSGCGMSRVFPTPVWQDGAYSNAKGRRVVADVGTVVGPYWVKYLANWTYADGTSASTPVFAAAVAVINQYRKAKGLPTVGFMNSLMYKHTATRAAFRDVTVQGWGGCLARTGYDLATGIGSPKVAELAAALP